MRPASLQNVLIHLALAVGTAIAIAATGPVAAAAGSPSGDAPGALAQTVRPPHLLVANGARPVWSPLRRRPRFAFDSIVDENNRNMAVFVMDGAGEQRVCMTCTATIPRGFVGMMDWLPDGKHLLVTAENERSLHRRFNHPSFGVDNDLWLVSVDGKRTERIWRTSTKGGAVLNARVNRAGTQLLFAERLPTAKPLPQALRRFGPGGEDAWAGWRLHVADIDLRRQGEAVLRNHRTLQPNGAGFYEPSGFAPDGALLYAFTPEGQRYCDDVWSFAQGKRSGAQSGTERTQPRNLTNSTATWEEHGQYTADLRWFGFVSSAFNPQLRFPGADNAQLVTELYLQRGTDVAQRLTSFNAPAAPAVAHSNASPSAGGGVHLAGGRVVSRFAFSPDSRRVLMQVSPSDRTAPPQLWLQELPR